MVIPKAIKDNFEGQAAPPLLLAEACKISPTSSNWRYLTGAAVAYGLIDGAYNSKTIALTTLGERIVAPLEEGDENIALKEAIMLPSVLSEFYKQFNNNKLPRTDIAYNLLMNKGIPKDKVETTWNILKSNAQKAQILKIISGNEYIFIDDVSSFAVSNTEEAMPIGTEEKEFIPEEVLEKMNIPVPNISTEQPPVKNSKPNIFISHGKIMQL